MLERIADFFTFVFWTISFLCGLLATFVLLDAATGWFNFGPFRGIYGLYFALALAIVPYCLARAFEELTVEVEEFDDERNEREAVEIVETEEIAKQPVRA